MINESGDNKNLLFLRGNPKTNRLSNQNRYKYDTYANTGKVRLANYNNIDQPYAETNQENIEYDSKYNDGSFLFASKLKTAGALGYNRLPNKELHRLASISMSKIGRNPLTRSIYRYYVSLCRSYALSVNDIRDLANRQGLPRSSRTIWNIVKDRQFKRGGRYFPRTPIKVKLETVACLLTKWIRYILGTGISQIPSIETIIEKELEPP